MSTMLPFALVAAAGATSAYATTFAPGTSREYIRRVADTLRQQQEAHPNAALLQADRFTPVPGRGIVTFIDAREGIDGIPSDRAFQVWWSYAAPGMAMEPSNGTLNNGFLPGNGQTVDILDANDPSFDNFQNVLFARLSGLPRPFGWQLDGGQRTWQTIIKDAINRWDQVCAVDFVFIPGDRSFNSDDVNIDDDLAIADQPNGDGGGDWDVNAFGNPELTNRGEGDIRIAMCELDGPTQPDGSAGGILAWTYDSVSPPIADLVDDNDTPMDPLDDEVNLGYCGNIILDKEERWNDPATPNLLATVITREIGFALGMVPACPSNPEIPIALMQIQDYTSLPGAGSQDPLPQLFFQDLQEDDIRSAHSVFGDSLDTWGDGGNTTTYTDAKDIFFFPPPGTSTFSYIPHLGIPEVNSIGQAEFPGGPVDLSIHNTGDIDRWRLSIPPSVVSGTLNVLVVPRGMAYINDFFDFAGASGDSVIYGECAGTPFEVDASMVRNLRIRVEAYDPFTNVLQLIDEVNATAAGGSEQLEIPVTAGVFYISILGDVVDDVQLYDLSIVVDTPLLEAGLEADDYLQAIDVLAFREEGFFGANATIGVVDGEHLSGQHDVFAGRTVPRVNWPGVEPAATSAGSHATIVAGVAAGAAIGGFEGLAPEASVASATVASQVFGDGSFSIGKSALYFALMGVADPTTASTLGLPNAASVVVAAFGAGGRTLNGEDTISQAFDIVASHTRATFVVAAGNSGQTEGRSFGNCVIQAPDPNGPGSEYLGYRTIVPPGTAFNCIVVGGFGFVDPVVSPPDFQDQSFIVAGLSSRGPIDSSPNINGQADFPDRRPGLDVIAPSTGIVVIPPDFAMTGGVPRDPCEYNGPQPTSLLLLPSIDPGDDPDAPANPGSFQLVQGTSVAAAIVGGAVALLQDVALEQSPPLSIHPSVMKAIILNGAEKLEGWTNRPLGPGVPQDQRDGFPRNMLLTDADGTNDDDPRLLVYNLVPNTTNPLDRAQGAGVINLRRSLENYFTGYAPVAPPQTNFDGPTINPPETDPAVPSIRIPDEPAGPGGGPPQPRPLPESPDLDQEGDGAGDAVPPMDAEVEAMRAAQRADEPAVIIGRPMQAGGGRGPDLKNFTGIRGGLVTTGPQTPFQIPSLGDDDPGTGPPGGTPGAIEPGLRPREIPPIFVDPIGWDLGNLDQRGIRQPGGGTLRDGFLDYVIDVPLLAERPDPTNPGGSVLPPDQLTITLCWQRTFQLTELNFSNPSAPRIGAVRTLELENLDLELFPCDSLGNVPPLSVPVRSSISTFNTTEHIFTGIPLSSLYLIRVRWLRTEYDVKLNQPGAEQQFGVAWRVDFSPRAQALRPTNATDLVNVLNGFGGQVGNERYTIPADIDFNGRIDWKDIMAVLLNWAYSD